MSKKGYELGGGGNTDLQKKGKKVSRKNGEQRSGWAQEPSMNTREQFAKGLGVDIKAGEGGDKKNPRGKSGVLHNTQLILGKWFPRSRGTQRMWRRGGI